jgi:hypothetical protein
MRYPLFFFLEHYIIGIIRACDIMDDYALRKIKEAEQLVAQQKRPTGKSDRGPVVLRQEIPIAEKGSFFLGYTGGRVVKASLIINGRVLSVLRPGSAPEIKITHGSMRQLEFLGAGKRLHSNLGDYNIIVMVDYGEEFGIPSGVQGYGAEVSLVNGEYIEDAVVREDNDDSHDVAIVYRSKDVGLRTK